MTPCNNAHMAILYLGCLNDDPETQSLLGLKCAQFGRVPRVPEYPKYMIFYLMPT